MKKFYLLSLLLFYFFSSSGQSVLDPNDTVVTYNPDVPVTQPTYGQIGKWVRTKRLSWNTNEYKCYIYEGCAFRLHFPKSYNPGVNDGKKYPMILFFHGLGEIDTSIYDNEYQLYHGGDVFQAAIDNGTFDGYALFMQSPSFWTDAQFQKISEIMDYMIANNKLDPFATTANGESAGGQGTWDMMFSKPTYVAADIPLSSISVLYTNQDTINKIKFTPIWDVQGGQDLSPAAPTAHQVRDAMVAAGANFTYTEFSTQGHDTWDSTWLLPQFYPYILSAYTSNPYTLFGRTKFCPGDNINVTIGLTAGFQAYQWRKNGNFISGAISNSINVTDTGTYDARVERNGIWSEWSRIPVQIVIQSASPTPPIQVSGLMSTAITAADGKNYVNLQVSGNGAYTSYTWKKVGSDSIYSTQPIFTATQPGYYTVAALPQYGCSALYSATFKVIDAKGPNAPIAVKSLVANTLSNTQVQLSWGYPAQVANIPTAFEIYRGTKSGVYSFITQVNPSVKNFIDSGISPKMKYYYTIRAIDSTGAAALSNEANVSISSDTIPPSIPASLKVIYTTPTTVSIAWAASTDNVAVDHYNIYVGGTLINITKNTSFILTGLVQNQSYAICVKAVDSSNNISVKSNQVTAVPMLGGLQYRYYAEKVPWKILPDFEALTPTETGITRNTILTVAKQSNYFGIVWQGYLNVPVTGVYTFQTTSDDGSAFWFNSYTPTGRRTINNDGAHGLVSKKSAAINITAGVYPVYIEYFQYSGSKSMALSWSSTALFGDTAQRNITDTFFNGTYNYAGVTPAAPTNLTATTMAYDKVRLTWKDNSNNESGFEIYSSTSVNGIYNLIAVSAANATSYKDSALTPATTYYYKIQAINKYGNSGLSTLANTTINGINYNYYTGVWASVPNFTPLTPVTSGSASNFVLQGASGHGYGFLYQGKINISTTGTYTFYTTSDNGSNLYIDGYSGSNSVLKNVYSSAPHEQSGSINLTAGTHTIFVSYFYNDSGNSGNAALSVSYQGPGISKQIIPNSVLTYQGYLSSATTYALPASPDAPSAFTATATSSSITLNWKSISNAAGYQLLRSIGDTSNYSLLTLLDASKTSYTDTGLNANLIHYYKIKTRGNGGTLSVASITSATTKNTAPVITKFSSLAVPYGVITTKIINASDSDGDALTYTTLNLPSFASIANYGSGGVLLTTNPSITNLGSYNNVTIIAADAFGGRDSTVFKLTVNSNYAPSVDSIADYTLNENDTLSLYLNATDQNSNDILTWSASNMPDSYVLKQLTNNTAKLFIHPNYLASGTYTPSVTVSDGHGGIIVRKFNLKVNDLNPNINVYARFKNVDSIGQPWNSITGVTTNNLIDAYGKTTNISLALQTTWFATYNAGATTGNNSGVYPDAVLKDYYYFGTFGGPDTVAAKITGLSTSKKYTLTFLGSSNYAGYAENGSTIYQAGSQAVALPVQNNTSNTVTISSVKPDSTGTISYKMYKAAGTQAGYINSLIISSIYNDGTTPVTPTSLTAQNTTTNNVQLSWSDVAYNETGYKIYRALSSTQVYSLVGQTQAEATGFIDTSVSGNTNYLYKIAAYNTTGASGYSNVAAITTLDRIPQLSAIADVIIKNNQTVTVNITAADDSIDHITLFLLNLPSFATFTDNGNGTGKIIITPSANNEGFSKVYVVASDNSNASDTVSFNILISNLNISSTYLSFSDGVNDVPKPWHRIASYPYAGSSYTGINDDSNVPTGMTLTFKNGFQGVVETGMQPVDGDGIYPNVVMRTGEYESTTANDTIQLSGLDTSKLYNFVFFNSHDDGKNCSTNFTIGSKTVNLNASYNLSKTTQINGIKSDASGIVNIIVAKDSGADYAFITTLVIQSYAPYYTSIAPTNLRTTKITRNSISLLWQDRASTETGYQIWRASDSSNSYSLITTVATGVKTYTDANLQANKTYTYIVRGVFGSAYSNFSNTITANTYAYSIYINYTASNDGLLPWNNLDAPPQIGYAWNNFFDEKGFVTGVGMQLNTEWAGVISSGMSASDKGIYPDVVMLDNYGLFPGQKATFQVTGLTFGMKYDFTFFSSSTAIADVNVAYTINNSSTVLLDASLNTSGTQTIHGVTPDKNGTVTISVSPGTSTSLFGLIGAMVIGAYTPSASTVIPALPQGTLKHTIANVDKAKNALNNTALINAYPNPFHDYFTLTFASQSNKGKTQIMVYDIIGKMVYSSEVGNHKGINTLQVITENSLAAGLYNVVIIDADTKKTQIIKVLKE